MSVSMLDRTPSSHSRIVTEGVWCFEREFECQEKRPAVRLVIFDWDETLTLSTFVPDEKGLREKIGWCEWADYITLHNFETPFVSSSRTRVEKLKELFQGLVGDRSTGEPRVLAVLTRNNQGVVACLNLLMMAGLADFFCTLWCMRPVRGTPNGVYRKLDGSWSSFSAPFDKVPDYKADVLSDICRDPAAWFPHVAQGYGAPLSNLKLEEVVLVDDVRTNFQSSSPAKAKVLRYCKVARYDCVYREHGFKRDMGGIGAKTDDDFAIVLDFVRNPWSYKAHSKACCVERNFDGAESKPRVDLVVFDFDETLTLHTWMPPDRQCSTEIGYRLPPEERDHYFEYNFVSPYTSYDRVKKLSETLEELRRPTEDDHGNTSPRTLAILTRNEKGAVAVLNLLAMAGLDHHFSAIWALGSDPEVGAVSGAYQEGSVWQAFELPPRTEEMEPTKCNVLRCIVKSPQHWFPQLRSASPSSDVAHLTGLSSLANIVLVDDELANFRGAEGDDDVVYRHCEVTRYDDDDFRGQGLITHMGGLGAKTEDDFSILTEFIRRPWLYREVVQGTQQEGAAFFTSTPTAKSEVRLSRQATMDELLADSVAPTRLLDADRIRGSGRC